MLMGVQSASALQGTQTPHEAPPVISDAGAGVHGVGNRGGVNLTQAGQAGQHLADVELRSDVGAVGIGRAEVRHLVEGGREHDDALAAVGRELLATGSRNTAGTVVRADGLAANGCVSLTTAAVGVDLARALGTARDAAGGFTAPVGSAGCAGRRAAGGWRTFRALVLTTGVGRIRRGATLGAVVVRGAGDWALGRAAAGGCARLGGFALGGVRRRAVDTLTRARVANLVAGSQASQSVFLLQVTSGAPVESVRQVAATDCTSPPANTSCRGAPRGARAVHPMHRFSVGEHVFMLFAQPPQSMSLAQS